MSKFIKLSLLAATAISRFIHSTLGKDRAAVDFPVTDTGRSGYFKQPLTAILVTLTLAFTLASCSSQMQQVEAFDKSLTVDQPYDEVWAALVRFMSTNDWGIDTIEKVSGLIQLDASGLSESFMETYCSFDDAGWRHNYEGGGVKGSITVVDNEGFVTINTNLRFFITSTSGFGPMRETATDECQSTGVLETSILNSVR